MLRKTLNISNKRSASDRFIPRREDSEFAYHLIDSSSYISSNNSDTEVNYSDLGIVNSAKELYLRKNYSKLLRTILLPNKNKVLQFSSPRIDHKRKNIVEENSWPVEARSKPLLTLPSIMLDMPDLSTDLNRQVIDWGKNGYVATAYNGEVHLWHPTKKERFVTNTNRRVEHCVKWNVNGTALAMSLGQSGIAIWNFERQKIVSNMKCLCNYGCIITAMVWTRTHNLITGCSNGTIGLYLFTDEKKPCEGTYFSKCIGHDGDIINIQLSASEQYLVTTGKDHRVIVWYLSNLEDNFEIVFDFPIKAVAFHPWRDSLLAVGTPKYLFIFNVNTKKIIDQREHPCTATVQYVDSLTFNPVSGELLVSCLCINNQYETFTSLKVLKNLSTVVDEVQFKFGRIPYLLWDATGTQLATAASDESLSIWNFFGKNSDLVQKRIIKKKTLTTDMFETLKMFGNTIR